MIKKAICLAILSGLCLGLSLWAYFFDHHLPAPRGEIDFYDVFFRPTMLIILPLMSAGFLYGALKHPRSDSKKPRD